MKRNVVIAAVAGLASLVLADTASAGGIIVDLREPAQFRSNLPDIFLATRTATSGGSSSDSGTGTDGTSAEKPDFRKKLPGVGPDELAQIQAGLITEDEAASGCGGASAAAGPAGILPIAVAGLALLRRRR